MTPLSARVWKKWTTPGRLPAALAVRRAQADGPALRRENRIKRPRYTAAAAAASRARNSLQGKELSYNKTWWTWTPPGNWSASSRGRPSPSSSTPIRAAARSRIRLAEAYRKAFEADPVSAFGGVIGINRPVDEETAREIAKTFIEAIAAPDYSAEALAILGAKKNLRLIGSQRE